MAHSLNQRDSQDLALKITQLALLADEEGRTCESSKLGKEVCTRVLIGMSLQKRSYDVYEMAMAGGRNGDAGI